MRIAIVSDTHDNHPVVGRLVEELKKERITRVLHCGDIESEETVWQFEGLETHFVLGNCDRDSPGLRAAIESSGGHFHGRHGTLEVDGRTLGWIHGDDARKFREMESAGLDFLFYGHTHVAAERRVGPTRVINPGALYRARVKNFMILDPAQGICKSIALADEV